MRIKTFVIAMTAILAMAVTPAFAQEEQGFKKFNVREDFTENGFQWFHDAELLAAGDNEKSNSRAMRLRRCMLTSLPAFTPCILVRL